jgi:hypothetical protein
MPAEVLDRAVLGTSVDRHPLTGPHRVVRVEC